MSDNRRSPGCLTRAAHPGLCLKTAGHTQSVQPVTPSLGSSRFDAVRAASWRLPWSCNPLLCVCSALQTQQSSRLDGSARFGLTAAPQANRECFRLHDCIAGRSLHARLQRLCSTAGRQAGGGHAMPCGRPIMPYLLASHGS